MPNGVPPFMDPDAGGPPAATATDPAQLALEAEMLKKKKKPHHKKDVKKVGRAAKPRGG